MCSGKPLPLGRGTVTNKFDAITTPGFISSIVSFAEIGFFVYPDSQTALGLLRPASTLLCFGFLPHNGTLNGTDFLQSVGALLPNGGLPSRGSLTTNGVLICPGPLSQNWLLSH